MPVITELVARTFWELESYPDPTFPFDELPKYIADQYRTKAKHLRAVLANHNLTIGSTTL